MIRGGRQPSGYTIVEAMIFLAVSGAIFLGAVLAIGGRQRSTQFGQALREVDAKLNDIINDVSTGFYPSDTQIDCYIQAGANQGPSIRSYALGSKEQGSNEECISIGKIVHFGPADSVGANGYNIFTVIGRRLNEDDSPVTTLDEALPVAVAPGAAGNSAAIDLTESGTLHSGLNVYRMTYNDGAAGVPIEIGAIGFFGSLGAFSVDSNDPISGSQKVEIAAVESSSLADTKANAISKINAENLVLNPGGGIAICFQDGNRDQTAVITIGKEGRRLSTSLNIDGSICP